MEGRRLSFALDVNVWKRILPVADVSWLCEQKRHLLEDSNQLEARRSALDDDLEDMDEDEEEGEFKVSSRSTFVKLIIINYFVKLIIVIKWVISRRHGRRQWRGRAQGQLLNLLLTLINDNNVIRWYRAFTVTAIRRVSSLQHVQDCIYN